MRTFALLLMVAVPAFGAQPLEPVSTIDFAKALNVKENAKRISIRHLAATPKGPVVAGGHNLYGVNVARADRNGSVNLSVPLRGTGPAFTVRPDGGFWFGTHLNGANTPAVAATGFRGAYIGPVLPDRASLPADQNYPGNYDLYSPDGRYVSSFRTLQPSLALAASENELLLVYGDLIRAVHIANGEPVVDREWGVNGSHLVFPLDEQRFAVINRMTGEFAIIDPRTPDTHAIAAAFRSPDEHQRFPVTAANGSIWFLVPGPSGSTRDLVRFAGDGSIVSRTALRIPRDEKPLLLAVSGRDVYIAGISPNVWRYELPQ